VRTLASEVGALRSALEAAAGSDKPDAFDTALRALEAKQLALGQVRRDYKDHLRVRTANLDDLRAALPTGMVLIEFRQFRPVDFRTGEFGEPRLRGVAVGRLRRAGAGRSRSAGAAARVCRGAAPPSPSAQAEEAATALYQRLFAPFESRLAAARTVYLAPDGPCI
jgi:hypothetical protein